MSFLWGDSFDKRSALFCNLVSMGAINVRWLQQFWPSTTRNSAKYNWGDVTCLSHILSFAEYQPICRACLGRKLSVILTYHYPFCVTKQNKKNDLKHLQLFITD